MAGLIDVIPQAWAGGLFHTFFASTSPRNPLIHCESLVKDCRAAASLLVALAVHVADEFLARLAQSLREHQDELHQDFCAEDRLLQNDAREAFAGEHREQ